MAIDNQLDKDKKKIGSCVALTSLYTVLGMRLDFDLSVLIEITGYEGAHILNSVSIGGEDIVVENTAIDGFDLDLDLFQGFVKEDLTYLVLATINCRGVEKLESGHPNYALKDFDKALRINPNYPHALNNRGLAKEVLGDFQGAMRDYERAIELKPDYVDALHNKTIVMKKLGK